MEKKLTRAIVADLHKDNGDMIGGILKSLGCEVIIANNVGKFSDAINDCPDLIIIDDPITEFIELLREIPRSKLPKLILISRDRYSKQEKEVLAEKLNTVEIVQFPFELNEFEKKISNHL